MKGHGPVIGDCVDYISHARMNRCLCRPDMGCHHRDILGYISIDRCHQFRIFLVCRIVGKFSESLVIHRFPDKPVKQSALLGDSGAQRIQIVLRTDYLGAGSLSVRIQIHPVRSIPHRVCRGGNGHGNPIMAEAHSDIAHDNAFFRVKALRQFFRTFLRNRYTFPKPDFLYPQQLTNDRILNQRHRIA